MTVDIFIRTYHKDIPWLNHALASIHKHVRGWRDIVITIPKGQGHLLDYLTAETVIEVDDLKDGYLGQQLTKMEAWKYTDADVILFWDSDVVATEPIDIHQEYFFDGKPILYKTRYSSIPGCPWQSVTEKAVGFSVEWEYMRRMPLLHVSEALAFCDGFMQKLHGQSVRAYLDVQPHHAFSEFNVIGAFVENYHWGEYAIQDTEAIEMPPNKVRQFYSWGGITAEVMAEIKSYL